MNVGVAVFVFALTANVAFAGFNLPPRHDDNDCDDCEEACCPSLTINNTNNANVSTKGITLSNTGLNLSKDGKTTNYSRTFNNHPSIAAGEILTGDGEAVGDFQIGANDVLMDIAVPAQGTSSINNNNNATINTMGITVANTGLNKVGNGKITTGYAGAGSSFTTVVNSTVIKLK